MPSPRLVMTLRSWWVPAALLATAALAPGPWGPPDEPRPASGPPGGRLPDADRAAGSPACRPKVVYPARLLDVLARAEADGRDVTSDFKAFERAWGGGDGPPCAVTVVMPGWSYRTATGLTLRGWAPGPGAHVDRETGERRVSVAITPETFGYIAAVDAVRRESGGDGRGTDRLTAYAFEPDAYGPGAGPETRKNPAGR